MNNPMMACGHSANAVTSEGKPCCAICVGLTPSAIEIIETPSLANRKAHCSYGMHAIVPSSTDLAFFQHQPNHTHDIYYCGCYGWD